MSNIPFESENLAQELVSPEVEYLYLQNYQSGSSIPIQMTGVQHIRIQNENDGVLSLFEIDIPGYSEDCGNGTDDDCDGYIDCEDRDCDPIIFNIDITAPTCGICPDGNIFIQAFGANSHYFLYSIDGGVNFQTENNFGNLLPGEYQIAVKNYLTGCTSTTTSNLFPPPGGSHGHCFNGGFEEGTFEGWGGGIGLVPISEFDNESFGLGLRHNILQASSGFDPIAGEDIPLSPPSGGTYFAKLGSSAFANKRASRLIYCLTVDDVNADLSFNYAIVLADGNDAQEHQPNEQPFFLVEDSKFK